MKKRSGFTLIELIITIALLAIIGTIIAVNMVGLNKKQTENEINRIESTIKAAAEAYADDKDLSDDCVSVQDLIAAGYLKKTDIENYKKQNYEYKSVKFLKNDSGSYNGEYEIREGTSCRIASKSPEEEKDSKPQDSTKEPATPQEGTNKKIIVKLDANGGNFDGKSTKELTYDYISLATSGGGVELTLPPYGELPSPTKEGFDFKYWYPERPSTTRCLTYTAISEEATISATTLYACWEPKKIQVTLDANGGTFSGNKKTEIHNVEYNDLYSDFLGDNLSYNQPKRNDGYSFVGWYTEKTGGTKIKKDTKITKDHTLYAHWGKETPPVCGTVSKCLVDSNGKCIKTLSKNDWTNQRNQKITLKCGNNHCEKDQYEIFVEKEFPKEIYVENVNITIKNSIGNSTICTVPVNMITEMAYEIKLSKTDLKYGSKSSTIGIHNMDNYKAHEEYTEYPNTTQYIFKLPRLTFSSREKACPWKFTFTIVTKEKNQLFKPPYRWFNGGIFNSRANPYSSYFNVECPDPGASQFEGPYLYIEDLAGNQSNKIEIFIQG